MKASRMNAAALALLFVIGILAGSVQAAPGIQDKKQENKAAAKDKMPKEVAALIQEGLATRQGRQDIPFSFFRQLVLPAQGDNLYPIFLFKAKNGDLGYAPSASGTGEMETSLNVFFQLFQPAENGTLKPTVNGKSLAVLKTAGEGYNAENGDWYSFGLGLAAGKYTLALALSTPDMKKMSVGYSDITLPGPEVHQAALWPSDAVILKAMEQVEPDSRPTIHRGYFTWGAVKFVSNTAGEIAAGDKFEVSFFVLGATPKDPAAERPLLDLEINFEVLGEDGKTAIKWAPQVYDIYFISQELPLLQTFQKMDEKGTVLGTEKKPLPVGNYTLVAKILDKVSDKKADAKMAFSIK